jgi:hypothetical protein
MIAQTLGNTLSDAVFLPLLKGLEVGDIIGGKDWIFERCFNVN